MKKKQWYVFAVLFFLLFFVGSAASRRPDIAAVDIDSYRDLAWWIDNLIEQTTALICIFMAMGCMICAHWAEDSEQKSRTKKKS